jgi:hypothetical protein
MMVLLFGLVPRLTMAAGLRAASLKAASPDM